MPPVVRDEQRGRGLRWTPKEDAILREHFHDRDQHPRTSLEAIGALVKRTAIAVWYRAKALRLLGCPPGMETIEGAARRVGVDTTTLRKALRRAGYHEVFALSRQDQHLYRHQYVEPIAADDAMTNWHHSTHERRDTPYDLGRRPGHVHGSTIRNRLRKRGIKRDFKDAPPTLVRECAFKGVTLDELGAMYEMSRTGVTTALRRAGLWCTYTKRTKLFRYRRIDLKDPRYRAAIEAHLPTYRRRRAGTLRGKEKK